MDISDKNSDDKELNSSKRFALFLLALNLVVDIRSLVHYYEHPEKVKEDIEFYNKVAFPRYFTDDVQNTYYCDHIVAKIVIFFRPGQAGHCLVIMLTLMGMILSELTLYCLFPLISSLNGNLTFLSFFLGSYNILRQSVEVQNSENWFFYTAILFAYQHITHNTVTKYLDKLRDMQVNAKNEKSKEDTRKFIKTIGLRRNKRSKLIIGKMKPN